MNREKILIVDDNPVVVATLEMKLKAAGYEVLMAMDGTEAVSVARKARPQLILMDISLPEEAVAGVQWDGFKIIEWLRRVEEAKDIPVIVITGGDAQKYKERSMALGAVAFFQKPIDSRELLEVVKKTLNGAANKAAAS